MDEFEIIRPLGSGATGQVYQAFDTVLGRAVAVKFLASESSCAAAGERFLIEARAIARLQHPNVLSIYRVGVASGRPYLVEEFVRGDSLDRIKLPMPWRRVLGIAVQLARGLAAAHRQGVLHRDIKPANVMLTEDGTAKLLDFGLAKLNDNLSTSAATAVRVNEPSLRLVPEAGAAAWPVHVDLPQDLVLAQTLSDGALSGSSPSLCGDQRSLTLAGSILGTPAYMSPEAWRGEPATERSDVYSLGALLYELLSGKPPNDFRKLDEIREAALFRDMPTLAVTAPGVDRRLARLVERCLARDPGLRFESGEHLLRALDGLSTELDQPAARALLRQLVLRRWPAALLVSVLLLAPPAVAVRHVYAVRAEQRRAAEIIKLRRSVAVVGLRGPTETGEHTGFGAAFSELLCDELAVGERLRRIPADSVARMKLDLHLSIADSYPLQVLQRIRQNLGADLVVSGSYRPVDGQAGRLVLHLEIRDTSTGARLALTEAHGSPSELFALVARTGQDLRQQLGITDLSAAQTAGLRAERPTRPEVAEQYAQGRELLRRFDAVGARRLLSQVLARDPDYPRGHLAMAEVYTALGYDDKAKAAAKRAFELSGNLPREDRYLIEARYSEASKDWDRAIVLYQSLLAFFPESVDYGLMLASAQLNAGQPDAASATTQRLRQLPAAQPDPRLDVLEAKARSDAGDSQTAYALLERAVAKGKAIDAPLLCARAHLEAAYVLWNMGKSEQALANATSAHALFSTAGDRGAAADALVAMSGSYMYLGDIARSIRTSEDALALLLRVENTALTAAHLGNMATLLLKHGDLKLARARGEAGLLLAREVGLLEIIGASYIALGWISRVQGNATDSGTMFRQAEETFQELGDPRMIAWAHHHRAELLLLRGDVAQAKQLHQQALAIREKHGLMDFAAESHAALAALALEQQQPSEAETHARAAVQQFVKEQHQDNEAWAQTLLAAALAAQGRHSDAEQALSRAVELVDTCQNLLVRLFVSRSTAQLRRTTEAVSRLEPARTQAQQLGMWIEATELEITQLQLQIEHKKGADSARSRLLEIAKESTQRELLLIAKKANNAYLSGYY